MSDLKVKNGKIYMRDMHVGYTCEERERRFEELVAARLGLNEGKMVAIAGGAPIKKTIDKAPNTLDIADRILARRYGESEVEEIANGKRKLVKCSDCKGTGTYQGLFAVEDCKKCSGKGEHI